VFFPFHNFDFAPGKYFVQKACKWYSLAAAQGFAYAKTNLSITESQMTPEQIAEAKQLSAAFVPRKEKSAQ
jgi:TPR repeat protein